MTLQKYIEINPEIMRGKPVLKGTRIPVELIIKKLAKKMDINSILRDYPHLTKEQIRAALIYASEILSKEEVYFLS